MVRAGLRGVRLEYVQVGNTRCTSKEALARFFEQLKAAYGKGPRRLTRTPAARIRAVDKAEAELRQAGV